jgi:hypothetical protein
MPHAKLLLLLLLLLCSALDDAYQVVADAKLGTNVCKRCCTAVGSAVVAA